MPKNSLAIKKEATTLLLDDIVNFIAAQDILPDELHETALVAQIIKPKRKTRNQPEDCNQEFQGYINSLKALGITTHEETKIYQPTQGVKNHLTDNPLCVIAAIHNRKNIFKFFIQVFDHDIDALVDSNGMNLLHHVYGPESNADIEMIDLIFEYLGPRKTSVELLAMISAENAHRQNVLAHAIGRDSGLKGKQFINHLLLKIEQYGGAPYVPVASETETPTAAAHTLSDSEAATLLLEFRNSNVSKASAPDLDASTPMLDINSMPSFPSAPYQQASIQAKQKTPEPGLSAQEAPITERTIAQQQQDAIKAYKKKYMATWVEKATAQPTTLTGAALTAAIESGDVLKRSKYFYYNRPKPSLWQAAGEWGVTTTRLSETGMESELLSHSSKHHKGETHDKQPALSLSPSLPNAQHPLFSQVFFQLQPKPVILASLSASSAPSAPYQQASIQAKQKTPEPGLSAQEAPITERTIAQQQQDAIKAYKKKYMATLVEKATTQPTTLTEGDELTAAINSGDVLTRSKYFYYKRPKPSLWQAAGERGLTTTRLSETGMESGLLSYGERLNKPNSAGLADSSENAMTDDTMNLDIETEKPTMP
ncbi:MAG: hypothetical protein ACHP65_08575 [Legionellales bacterium]